MRCLDEVQDMEQVSSLTHLGQSTHPSGTTLPNLLSHRRACQINAQLVDETRLMRPVYQRVRLGNPELLHCSPVAHDDGPLAAEHALKYAGLQLLRPFSEDGGIILAAAASEGLEVAYEWQG